MAYYAPPLTSSSGFTLGNGSTSPAFSSGTASMSGGTDGYYPAIYSSPVTSNAWYVQGTLASSPTSVAAGFLIGCNTTFSQQIAILFNTSGTYITLVTNATGSSATNEVSTGTVWSSGDVCRVTAVGNYYTVYRNGSLFSSWPDSGGATSSGASYKYGGLVVQRSSFTNSCSLSNLIIADLPTPVPRPNYIPIYRSTVY